MTVITDPLIRSIEITQLERLYELQNFWNSYVYNNQTLIGKADQSLFVTFVNPNLYEVSVKYYSSVDFWTVIATANNLTDPEVRGTVTLLIPPKPVNSFGGILQYFNNVT